LGTSIIRKRHTTTPKRMRIRVTLNFILVRAMMPRQYGW
jgi:hypothetical protein